MTTLALTAVGRTRGQAGVALAANLLVAVVLAGQHLERGLNDTTTQAVMLVFHVSVVHTEARGAGCSPSECCSR